MIRARWALGLVLVAMGAALVAPGLVRQQVQVSPGDSLQEAIAAAPEGARLVLRGTFEGPIVIDRSLEVIAERGARIVTDDGEPALTIAADGVRVQGLSTAGGSTGIRIREVDGVRLEDVRVRGAELHGIEVIDASAFIERTDVAGLRHELAQGIEVRNSDGRPDSVVRDSEISGGQEGIVSHVSEVVVEDNLVRDTSLRAITITEMSDGVVTGNTIRGATGAGLYCGDMSRCQFGDNDVAKVGAIDLGRSTEGWGLVVTYHAAASSARDRLEGQSGAVFTSTGGHLRDRSPLELGAGAGAILPVGVTVAVSLAAFALVLAITRPAARILTARRSRSAARACWVLPVAIAGIAVQTFHMIEHGLQVFRVHVDGIPSRGGLAGPRVEVEWVHFVYNALVLLALIAVVAARSRGWVPPGRRRVGHHLLIVAAAIQSYHVIEHSVKVAQHVTGGAKVNPGIAGQHVDLVLLHFGINLAVYVACVAAAVFYALSFRERHEVSRVPQYATSGG